MTNDRLERALECSNTDDVPFIPAIYEHKAWFVNETPSRVARDADLLAKAMVAEYESVQSDALTVGVDVYNVEAEALGCEVIYYEGDDTSIPAISAEGAIYSEDADFKTMRLPDPEKDGRMPVNIEAARRVVEALGSEVPIRGALSGPFSMAANLVGPERLFMLTVTNPQFVRDLLIFAANVAKRYGEAFVRTGCGVVVFDSQASPELLSPKMYRQFVLPPTRLLIDYIHNLGVKHVPLIIGGNTTKILDSYLNSGANNLLCDFSADVHSFVVECSKSKRSFRRNIDSSDFLNASTEDLHRRTLKAIDESEGFPGYVVGTSVVPYGTPLEKLKAIREAVIEHRSGGARRQFS